MTSRTSTSVDKPLPDLEKALGQPLKGLKIGIPKEYRVEGMSAEIEALWQKGIAIFKDAGATIVDISLPHTKAALPAYYIVAPAEASSNLARYDGVRYGLRVNGRDIIDMYEETRSEGFGAEVKRRILIGTYVLSAGYYDAYYLKAQKVRSLIKRDFDDAFEKVDAVLTPTTPDARLCAWFARWRGPARDVSERHLHGDGEHGRSAGLVRACGFFERRPAARASDHREAVRRGARAPRRPGDRGRRGPHADPCALVGEWERRREARRLQGADPEEAGGEEETGGGRSRDAHQKGGVEREAQEQAKWRNVKPSDCESMDQVRVEIDRIDELLIDLVAERFSYVDRAWQLKKNPAEATVPWRIRQVIDKVEARAKERGLPPELAVALWRQMIGWFIQYEEENLAQRSGEAKD